MPFELPTTPCIEIPESCRMPKGYGRIRLTETETGRRRQVLVHRRIMERVLGRRLGQWEQVMHLCDNPPCFRFDHLQLGTLAENLAMAAERGQMNRGENNHYARLTEGQVRQIRALTGTRSDASIATEFGVGRSTVGRIRRGDGWRHLW